MGCACETDGQALLSDTIKDLLNALPNTANIKPLQSKFTTALTAISTKTAGYPTNGKTKYMELTYTVTGDPNLETNFINMVQLTHI